MTDSATVTPIKSLRMPKPPKKTRMTREVESALGWQQWQVRRAVSIVELVEYSLQNGAEAGNASRAENALHVAADLLRSVDCLDDAISLQQLGEKLATGE